MKVRVSVRRGPVHLAQLVHDLRRGRPGTRTWFELLYLSITTMTSTGLSDIIAVTPHARSFVLLQQISGMLYVALVVARLVGLTIARFRQ